MLMLNVLLAFKRVIRSWKLLAALLLGTVLEGHNIYMIIHFAVIRLVNFLTMKESK
jgi:hypothetical protein